MTYDAKAAYSRHIQLQQTLPWPAEYVIRIFKGIYPRLDLPKHQMQGASLCDVGCGDGRNFPALAQSGFKLYGVEIGEDIVSRARRDLEALGIHADLRVGTNASIPFEDQAFDYLLSWNACYYMDAAGGFDEHVREFARVLAPGGRLVLSIPKRTAFIYEDAESLPNGYCVIRNDPFGVRNGQVMRIFEDEREIEKTFDGLFEDFRFGSIHDDCFGYDYHWHLVVARRRA